MLEAAELQTLRPYFSRIGVQPGDHVSPGHTLASHATQFPFQSQIDAFTGRTPHIHIEVKAR